MLEFSSLTNYTAKPEDQNRYKRCRCREERGPGEKMYVKPLFRREIFAGENVDLSHSQLRKAVDQGLRRDDSHAE